MVVIRAILDNSCGEGMTAAAPAYIHTYGDYCNVLYLGMAKANPLSTAVCAAYTKPGTCVFFQPCDPFPPLRYLFALLGPFQAPMIHVGCFQRRLRREESFSICFVIRCAFTYPSCSTGAMQPLLSPHRPILTPQKLFSHPAADVNFLLYFPTFPTCIILV
jgi:hypothetical protein